MSRSSPSVERVVAILDLLAARHGEPLSFSDIARELGLSKATTHSVLLSLAAAGYVIRDPRTMRYQLGAALIPLGNAAARVQVHAAEFAAHEMQQLADRFGLQSAAFTVVEGDIAIVATKGSPPLTSRARRVGQRVPFRPPFGTMFLAWAADPVRDEWFRRRRTDDAAEHDRLVAALAAIRTRGFGVWLTQEALSAYRSDLSAYGGEDSGRADLLARINVGTFILTPEILDASSGSSTTFDVDNIAAPVFDWRSEVALMLSLVGFDRPLHGAQIGEMAQETLLAAARVTETIGGVRPKDVATGVTSSGDH